MIFLLDNLKGESGKNKSDMKTIILTPPQKKNLICIPLLLLLVFLLIKEQEK